MIAMRRGVGSRRRHTDTEPTASVALDRRPPDRVPEVSAVVLAWPPGQKRDRNVFHLLDQLALAGGVPDIEVLVLCNGWDEALCAGLRSHARVDVLLTAPVNVGVARGWNIAAGLARGRTLCFLNEDVVLTKGTLTSLTEAACAAGVGLAGTRGQHWRTETMHPVRDGRPVPPTAVFAVSGEAFAVPRGVWHSVGGVDEALSPAMYEEVDLALKMSRAGKTAVVVPNAGIVHRAGASGYPLWRRIRWVGGSTSVAAIHWRNRKHLLRAWQSGSTWARPSMYVLLYGAWTIRWTLRFLGGGVAARRHGPPRRSSTAGSVTAQGAGESLGTLGEAPCA